MSHVLALVRFSATVAISLFLVPIPVVVSLLGKMTGRSGRLRTLRILTHLTSAWSRINLALLGIRVTTPDPHPGRAGLITSNHLSYLDILILGGLFPSRFIAKREIASWPLIGLLTRSAGTLFLERGRNREVTRLGAEIQETLTAGISVIFFPEGQITDGTTVQPFFGGLLETAVQESIECLPVCIHYETADPSASPAANICWASSQPFLSHFWRLMRIGRIEATVRWAEAPLAGADRKQLAERLHRETLKMFTPVRR